MSESPTPNGPTNGRTASGRFAPGWRGGPGNPHAAAVGRARAAFYKSLRDADVTKALETIRDVMKSGSPSERLAAARELLDRAIGKSVQSDLLERIEALELRLSERGGNSANAPIAN